MIRIKSTFDNPRKRKFVLNDNEKFAKSCLKVNRSKRSYGGEMNPDPPGGLHPQSNSKQEVPVNISHKKSKCRKVRKPKQDVGCNEMEQLKDKVNTEDSCLKVVRENRSNTLNSQSHVRETKGISKWDNLENKLETKLTLSKPKVADITHKNCNGNNNWMKFLQGQNATPKTLKSINSVIHEQNRDKETPKKPKFTRVVALDCEMVGIGDHGRDNMLARVSLVNSRGDCIYDKFVKPREDVIDYRTPVSGVRPEDISTGEEFSVVQKEVSDILKNRILVGHSLKSDLDVLFLSHPRKAIRDTSKYLKEPGKGTPSLKNLALQYLGVKIQEGEHNSVIDAKAAVQLYNMFCKEWESRSKLGKSNHFRNISKNKC